MDAWVQRVHGMGVATPDGSAFSGLQCQGIGSRKCVESRACIESMHHMWDAIHLPTSRVTDAYRMPM
jgi:hypothetical protein